MLDLKVGDIFYIQRSGARCERGCSNVSGIVRGFCLLYAALFPVENRIHMYVKDIWIGILARRNSASILFYRLQPFVNPSFPLSSILILILSFLRLPETSPLPTTYYSSRLVCLLFNSALSISILSPFPSLTSFPPPLIRFLTRSSSHLIPSYHLVCVCDGFFFRHVAFIISSPLVSLPSRSNQTVKPSDRQIVRSSDRHLVISSSQLLWYLFPPFQ